MSRRFCNPRLTQMGRIGHPIAIQRKLVKCVGVTFEDRQEGKLWTFRKYDAYSTEWPAMDVWTVQVLVPVKMQGRFTKTAGYGPQTPVPEEEVPEEVTQFAMAELVRQRLLGRVRG
jgi:hypothetical protein